MATNKSRRANGEGSIWFNEDQRTWIGRIRIGIKANNTPKYKVLRASTKKEVSIKMAESTEKHPFMCTSQINSNVSLSEYIIKYVFYYLYVKKVIL